MGIQGWNTLLIAEGWLPEKTKSDYAEASSLWSSILEESLGTELSNRIEAIPLSAEIHIDGNGLAFFLQSVATSRKFNQVLKASKNKTSNISWSSLSDYQIRELLPTFCPLSLLHEVTKEFIEALAHVKGATQRKLIVYWDGDDQYVFKQETRQDRLVSIDVEHSNMQQYCLTGRMPPKSKYQSMEYDFPRSNLFSAQVKHTIEFSGLASTVVCNGEADHEIAKAASLNSNAFVLGNDSDFCFFSNINYIPIYTLGLSVHGSLSGVVLRRDVLAESLQLPDEAAIVELAILMGNDYIIPREARLNGATDLFSTRKKRRSYNDLITFLNEKGTGFRLTSISENTEEILRFIRMLYNLEDLFDFEYARESNDLCEELAISQGDNLLEESAASQDENSCEDSATSQAEDPLEFSLDFRPEIPEDINLELAEIRPLADSSVSDAVVRCLQDYIDRMQTPNDNKENPVVSQDQLDAFRKQCQKSPNQSNVSSSSKEPFWRPCWEDVCAAYIIEKIISYSMKSNFRSLVVRMSPPFLTFNQFEYHRLLQALQRSREKIENSPRVVTEIEDGANRNGANKKAESALVDYSKRVHLPVDDFEEIILSSVRRNRVTIIQGETGCGKSTRIPMLLLKNPPENATVETSKLFIAQPRRIAAKALVEHLRNSEPDLRDQIALRMGHGVKEYENSTTQAWFVTTGYLVRLMSCYPEHFDNISYVIIDEVHERSISTDLLCLLCRRMLQTNKNIRLILMSATLAAALYQNYFQVPEPPIKVGARRFPVDEIYIEDIESRILLPKMQRMALQSMNQECLKLKCSRSPSISYMEKLYTLASFLATSVGSVGSSVLIFVPGMQDIVQLTEMIELACVPNVKFVVFPIHGDIPFEDQMNAFAPAGANEVKIVIATNAAESSVTIPDVDHIICLGLCKQIVYNEASHRQMLVPTWISRASANQRKGRAGRLRPGCVYRLYPRFIFENYMEEFDPGEIARMPLDSVILMLKVMLPQETTTDLLQDCIEPPDTNNIYRSFSSLHQSHFITSDDEDFEVTLLGSFVSSIGIDLALGSLIGLGIQFGVGPEAIQLAAILSFPKSPWIISNTLVHEPNDFNEMTVKTYVSKCHFDANLYSEPLAVMNLLWEYDLAKDKNKWCVFYGIHQTRLRRLDAVYRNLRSRVAEFCNVDESLLKLDASPNHMPHSKVNILRIIQVWVFHDSMIKLKPSKALMDCVVDSGITLNLERNNADVNATHFNQLLKSERHPFTLSIISKITHKGKFTINPSTPFTRSNIECRLLSYASEKDFTLICIVWIDCFYVYVRDSLPETPGFDDAVMSLRLVDPSDLWTMNSSSKKRRGAGERPCGCWSVVFDDEELKDKWFGWTKFDSIDNKICMKSWRVLQEQCSKQDPTKSISLDCRWKNGNDKCQFEITTTSPTGEKVSTSDLNDLFASSDVTFATKSSEEKKLILPKTCNSPVIFHAARNDSTPESSSWHRPAIQCIPESARLLSVIASGRRSEHVIRFQSKDEDDKMQDLDVNLDQARTKINGRWKRADTSQNVFVETNSVPASAVPLDSDDVLYCACANTLELKGGNFRVEGLTLLPAGFLFYYLCKLTFGLEDDVNIESLVRSSLSGCSAMCDRDDIISRIDAAGEFNQSSMNLGERLECFPHKVIELISIFDGVDGYESSPWDNLNENPFIFKDQGRMPVDSAYKRKDLSRKGRQQQKTSDILSIKDNLKLKYENSSALTQLDISENSFQKFSEILFGRMPKSDRIDEKDLPSTNICSVVVSEARAKFSKKAIQAMTLHDGDWCVFKVHIENEVWYFANFLNVGLPYVHHKKANKFPSWIQCADPVKPRPSTIGDAVNCVPKFFAQNAISQMREFTINDGRVLIFRTFCLAVQMEAAFWLERQFRSATKHWYELADTEKMVRQLVAEQSRQENMKSPNVPQKKKNKKVKEKS